MGELIFVEGAPGTGKSATAQFLARQLTRTGRRARWIYEQEAANPLVPEPPAGGYRSWDEFAASRVARWQTVAAEIAASDETVVAESALLQLPVFSMLGRNAERGTIEQLVNRLAHAVERVHPRLVHLAHADPTRAWRAIAARRGAAFVASAIARSDDSPFAQTHGLAGLDAVLAYWRAHAALCDDIVAWLPMRTLSVDAAAGTWAERRRRICAFLDLPADEPEPPSIAELAPLAGRYGDATREMTIALEAADLVLRGVLWAANPLVPVAPGVFDVEAWPYRVRFERGGDGAVARLRWEGPPLNGGTPAGVYRRLGVS
ncbi:MAG: hypothetical protein FJ027_04205 [Candidatus Rokubacteria bacterium]|nr:hypothetical protein [Candidatus Rokubacteria bacterium]